jgi:hypothetical protein
MSAQCYDVTVDLFALRVDTGDRDAFHTGQTSAQFNSHRTGEKTIMLQLQSFLVLVLIVGTSVTAGKYRF